MKTLIFIGLISIIFIGCSHANQNRMTLDEQIVSEENNKSDEFDRIDSEFKDQLNPSTNALKRMQYKKCQWKVTIFYIYKYIEMYRNIYSLIFLYL